MSTGKILSFNGAAWLSISLVSSCGGGDGGGILAQKLLLHVCRCLVIGLMHEQKEECLSSTGCEGLKTDMFVSHERESECMMTSLIFPTTHTHSTSRNSMSFCFFKCDSKKQNGPQKSAVLVLQSRSLSKSLSITRAAWIKDDDKGPLQGLIPLQEQLG